MADGAWLPDGTFRHLLYFDADTVDNMLSWPHSGWPLAHSSPAPELVYEPV